MLQFLKIFAAVAAMSLIIPLCVWAITGSLRHGLHAWKQWAQIMAVMLVTGGGLGMAAALLT